MLATSGIRLWSATATATTRTEYSVGTGRTSGGSVLINRPGYPAEHRSIPPTGGRTWWAHLEFTRINITLTILLKKIEDLMNVSGVGEKSFLKMKPLITVAAVKASAQNE
jgi:hypothetical protein